MYLGHVTLMLDPEYVQSTSRSTTYPYSATIKVSSAVPCTGYIAKRIIKIYAWVMGISSIKVMTPLKLATRATAIPAKLLKLHNSTK